MFCIVLFYYFHCAHFNDKGTSDKLVEAVDLLKERAEEDDPNSLFALVNDLSKVTMLFITITLCFFTKSKIHNRCLAL